MTSRVLFDGQLTKVRRNCLQIPLMLRMPHRDRRVSDAFLGRRQTRGNCLFRIDDGDVLEAAKAEQRRNIQQTLSSKFSGTTVDSCLARQLQRSLIVPTCQLKSRPEN